MTPGDGHEKEETYLSSEQMPKSPRTAGVNGEHCLCVPWKRPWEVKEETGSLSKFNRIWSLFCLEKQLIITKLVQNQMVGQIFDKFWEIKSAKCC